MATRFAAGTINHQQARELNKMAAMLERVSNSFMGGGGTSLIKCDGKVTAVNSGSISGVTNANPAEITSTAHGMIDGETVTISGVTGSGGVNGTFVITSTGTDTFTVPVDAGGAYIAGGTWKGRRYSWTEQQYNPANGVYVDKINGRVGIPTDMYAYERNLALIEDFPFFAEMTQRSRINATVVFEFDKSATSVGSSCTESLINVCPTLGPIAFVKSGGNITDITIDLGAGAVTLEGLNVVTGLTVKKKDCMTGDVTCEDDPTDCCGVMTECCPDDQLPSTLYLTFSNLTGSCVDCVPLTAIPLVWSDAFSAYISEPFSTIMPNCDPNASIYGSAPAFHLYCDNNISPSWVLSGVGHINFSTISVTTAVGDMTCNPFSISGTTPEFHLCNYDTDGGPGSADFTITE